jgi:hypothetical protein
LYLPREIPDARVLISVKTYPLPSSKYGELVCTAGFLPDGKWIRLYPIPFRTLPYDDRYAKYQWVTLDLIRNEKDFRPESYRPKFGIEEIKVGEKIDTGKNRDWAERKKYVLREVFTSMNDIIQLAKGEEKKSLATLKPHEIIDFVFEKDTRDWKQKWQDQARQYDLFDLDEKGEGKKRSLIAKVPYKYSYKFLTAGDTRPRKLMIEDWEIGMLYWNCLRRSNGDEKQANLLVKQKYFNDFCLTKDIHLFLGTTFQHHLRNSPDPFVIIGVFVPPKPSESTTKEVPQSTLKTEGIKQQTLFDLNDN